MSKFISKISKEEINELPLIEFGGQISVIDSKDSYYKAIQKLKGETVLGFDTESRPSFKKGEHHPVSLLQLSTDKNAYLFRLNKYPLQQEIIDILESNNVVKAGVAIHDDLKGLQALKSFEPGGFEEIVDLAKAHNIENFGLRAIAAIVLEGRISKKAQLSNWAKNKLEQYQLTYAATDAWIGYRLYKELTA